MGTTLPDPSICAISWIKLNQSHSSLNDYLTAQGGDNYVLNLMVKPQGAYKKVRKVKVIGGTQLLSPNSARASETYELVNIK